MKHLKVSDATHAKLKPMLQGGETYSDLILRHAVHCATCPRKKAAP